MIRKLISFVILLCCTLFLGMAQKPVTFHDFQIGDKIQNAYNLLESKGCECLEKTEATDYGLGPVSTYSATYGKYERIGLSITPDSNGILRAVTFAIPAGESFQEILDAYNYMKTNVTAAFGKPTSTLETALECPGDETTKFRSLKSGSSNLISMYQLPSEVMAIVAPTSDNDGCAILAMFADQNYFSTLLQGVLEQSANENLTEEKIGHMTFKGIPIDGSLDSFIGQLKSVGFTLEHRFDKLASMRGEFAGVLNTQVIIAASGDEQTVYKVGALFPSASTWTELTNLYEKFKAGLKRKYGVPSSQEEKFDRSYIADTDSSTKFHELRQGRCTYYTSYLTPKGSIELSLHCSSSSECCVRIVYEDAVNSWMKERDAMDEL